MPMTPEGKYAPEPHETREDVEQRIRGILRLQHPHLMGMAADHPEFRALTDQAMAGWIEWPRA